VSTDPPFDETDDDDEQIAAAVTAREVARTGAI
jgi:hypothetical protein